MMYRSHKAFSIILTAALVLATFSAALAAPAAQGLLPCSADAEGNFSGTVVEVDEDTGLVTLDPGDGVLCTVNVSVDETHPIALLLGYYFGDSDFAVDQEAKQEALTNAETCATTPDGGVTWNWAACGTEGAQEIRVTGVNPGGTTYKAVVLNPDGTLGAPIASIAITDAPTVERVNGALATLAVDWVLEADGSLMLVSDQIAAMHEEGMGFGVLVKLFALSEASGVPVEDLKIEFQSGVGMGQLFKNHGDEKPDLRGVGHVRKAVNSGEEATTPGTEVSNGQGNGQGNGLGNGNTPPGQEKKADKPPKDKDNKLKGTNHAVPKGNGKGGNKP